TNTSRRYMEQAPDKQAIASTTSSMDRPALIDIKYSTLCSPVHNEPRSLLIAMLQLAPATRGSLNAAASRATAVGSKTVSASTVKSRSPLANRAAPFIAALRPQRVPWQMTMSTRPSARARSATARVSSVRAVIHDNDFDRPQGLSLQRRDRGAESRAAVERRYNHADRGLARRNSIASSAHDEQSQRHQRQRIARNVEYQHREGEQQQIRSGKQLHRVQHSTQPIPKISLAV